MGIETTRVTLSDDIVFLRWRLLVSPRGRESTGGSVSELQDLGHCFRAIAQRTSVHLFNEKPHLSSLGGTGILKPWVGGEVEGRQMIGILLFNPK